ncbi:Mn2+-dependent serine/threonine protein kinase [Caldisphaera lagunensis DSM 15908]|uniref:Mn2+-dependent serine/threonine protein kinase n=1 Tax=Caldisphaera lagunensis (strain DSM 15908 / JCM 11604 / ANMR 0165 / IC-154) TaxID=1056495 RepID=L0A9H0_CALLD|nr:serine/threonine protein kinase [Caldisphaera lagunensis]AFZ70543.1 Mn2+-dependent serine/threonine protein kinase [Caldisphaera lagunensis DSM 15908]
MEGEIKGINYKIKIVNGFKLPTFENNTLVVGDLIFSADVKLSTLGDVVSGLLIPPVEYDDTIKSLVEYYKLRVTIEQAYEISQRYGELANKIRIPIEFIPLSRMQPLRNIYSCIFNDVIDKIGVEGLRKEYEDYIKNIGSNVNGNINLNFDLLNISTNKIMGNIGKNVILGFLTMYSGNNFSIGKTCKPNELIENPYSLLSLPEGSILNSCNDLDNYIKNILGYNYSCKRPGLLFSSQICENDKNKVVIKEYMYGTLKWFMAGAVSASIFPFKETPLARLGNEYNSLIDLRKIVNTPKILSICIDKYEYKMMREFIKGEVVLKSKNPYVWSDLGSTLALIHNNNRTLGDSNPGNFVVTDEDKMTLIDAEQVSNYTPKKAAWDIAVFYAYARTFQANSRLVREALGSYVNSRPKDEWKKVLNYIKGPHLTMLMTPLPNLLTELRLTLRELDND